MRKNLIISGIMLALISVSCYLCQAQTFTTFDKQYRYYYGTMSKAENSYYRFYVPANEVGVLTLKTKTFGSDFDVYAYSSSNMAYSLGNSRSGGLEPELLILPVESSGRWVYVKIRNDGTSGQYHFYAHTVNVEEKFYQALFVALLEGILSTENDVDNRNISRGINVASSLLSNASLGDASRSFILNEITNALREEFGYGAVAGFVVSFVVSYYDDILKNVW
ncbi:hypothetical protein [Pontibacter sp. G13]|uniref:hypothetical protein n=1 Tax=Pontibacter sp. G13 TaxID=3074898 RepID=UPI0028899733|nr:hypothetical protein [Pontibacter sp. G13]WNJ20092.1 hypothetical protein RJD25_06370 [Pontibacter sp. G13]